MSLKANHPNYPGTGTPSDWKVANEPVGDYLLQGISLNGNGTSAASVTLGDGTVVPIDITDICTMGTPGTLFMRDDDNSLYVKDMEISAVFQQRIGAPGSNGNSIAVSSNQAKTSITTTGYEPFMNDAGSAGILHDFVPHLWWGTNDPAGNISVSACDVRVSQQFSQPADLATGVPWNWFGNYFMSLEDHCAPGTTGNTTARPVVWNLNAGAITDDQIVQFETTVAQLEWTFDGTITMTFHNPTSGLDEVHTASFSI